MNVTRRSNWYLRTRSNSYRILKKSFFHDCRKITVKIFLNCNHTCLFSICFNFFVVFSTLENYNFKVFLILKVILHVRKITSNIIVPAPMRFAEGQTDGKNLGYLPFINAASFLSDLVRCVVIFFIQAISKLHHLVDLVIISVHSLLEFLMLLDQFLHGLYGGLLKKRTELKMKINLKWKKLQPNKQEKEIFWWTWIRWNLHQTKNLKQADTRSFGRSTGLYSIVTQFSFNTEWFCSLAFALSLELTQAISMSLCVSVTLIKQSSIVLTPLSSLDKNSSCWPRMASHCLESRMNNYKKGTRYNYRTPMLYYCTEHFPWITYDTNT